MDANFVVCFFSFCFTFVQFYTLTQELATRLQIARLVHVADETLDGDVDDRFAEKEFLDCRRNDGAQGRQQEQEAAEVQRLVPLGRRHVTTQSQLRLVNVTNKQENCCVCVFFASDVFFFCSFVSKRQMALGIVVTLFKK